MSKYIPQLFPNPDVYNITADLSDELAAALQAIQLEKLHANPKEQKKALKLIENWVNHIWTAMHFLVDSQLASSNKKSKRAQLISEFKQEFHDKLLSFISNPDHGIVHSFFVYKGMLYLSKKEAQPIETNSSHDLQAQLFALLHDMMQDLPFTIVKNKKTARINQKNDHAKIMAKLIKQSGIHFGFDEQTIEEFSFGILVHDSSYFNLYYSEALNYISKLGHDSDKLLGASTKTDPYSLTESMLKRNYEANRGPKGSYLIRTELDSAYRSKIKYGDRCLSDSVSLVKKEFTLQMYTNTGKKMAQKRVEAALDQIRSVYGYFFDLTQEFIDTNIIPNIGKKNTGITMSTVGMDQDEIPIDYTKLTKSKFKKLISDLYKTPIQLHIAATDKKKFSDRYNLETDARGLKLHVQKKDSNTDIYLDPSIARFCFMPNGREAFIKEITQAFSS